MKRGVDENSQGPMFPRLHVNDTEKGPRAPPRNKMALYEQLSIPSQKISGGLLPVIPKSIANYPPIPSSLSQVNRGSFFPLQQTQLQADKTNNRYSNLNNQLLQQDQKKKQDDDFRVPIFAQQSGINLDCNVNHQNKDGERHNTQDLPKSASFQSSRLQSNRNSQDYVIDSQRDNDPANGDAVSETSMVDSISGADISPDDVVGMIGQKHFWKARKAIVNQQRLFAVQVFELHRLIKVQKLIAGLPHPVVEDDSFLGKPQKVSPIKKIPLNYVTKDYHEKPKDDTREFSAENAVEKTSLSSVQNNSSRYPLQPCDPRMGPWGMMSHPPGHQWLIPVMSPSEGLIYKPFYPGPGYMNSGPGPPGFGHNMVNHGVPPPGQPHYQWPTGFPPLVHPPAHGYFPPYGMTSMNTTGGGEDANHQPTYKSVNASNNCEVQVSTASSVSDKIENQDPLPLFPMCPPAEGSTGPSCVIRVVPHNARLATESVARIFQSIQDERKRQDQV